MAIIVTHKKKGGRFILVGSGFGAYKAIRPSVFLGHLAPHEEEGTVRVVLLCDHRGAVAWIDSREIEVLSVDGQTPGELLSLHSSGNTET